MLGFLISSPSLNFRYLGVKNWRVERCPLKNLIYFMIE